MKWQTIVRPEVAADVSDAATWCEEQSPGLGGEFIEAVIRVWQSLEENPLLNSRRTTRKDIRWRFPERFPYRIIYEVDEVRRTVIIYAVTHAARHDRRWQGRVS